MKANLVCKGGGVKGIALVGCVSYLENKGYEWNNLAGTSAGAIVASLLAVGYTSSEIKEMLYDIDYTKFRDNNKLLNILYLGELGRLIFRKGLHNGNYIESFLNEKFKAKGKLKFRDISKNGISRLKIIASDVTRRKLLILPDDLVDYGIDPLDFEIAKAVRMSTCIPLYYSPITLNYKGQDCYIVDGGLLSNFPIWIFDTNTLPQIPTFGLNLTDEVQLDKDKHVNVVSYLLDVIYTSLSTNEDVYYKEKDFVRIINIPTLGVGATDFNVSNTVKDNLFQSGFLSADLFLKNWNFDRYVSKFYR